MNNKYLFRFWMTAFIIGILSPFIAMVIKPSGYSFFIFLPAKPHTAIGQVKLLLANVIYVTGFLTSIVAAIMISIKAFKVRKYFYLLCPVIILFHPLQQPLFLERFDTYMNFRLRDKAVAGKVTGKKPEEILNIFGKPSTKWVGHQPLQNRDGTLTGKYEKYTTWEYKPLPFYWAGSKLQIFFVNGVVSNFEADDD